MNPWLYLLSTICAHSCNFPHTSVGSCRVKLIPEVWSYFRYKLLKVIFVLLCTLYNVCIVFWYYPLFVAICEILLLKLTYGVYLVLSLKSGITIFMHCLSILPLICSYMWDLTSKTHIWCISDFVLKIGYYIAILIRSLLALDFILSQCKRCGYI